MEQRFAFNDVAEVYAKARADYPEALFDDLAAAAKLTPDDAILELGCGTGKATQALARRHPGRILALDPGAELIRVARGNLADFPQVAFVTGTFEAWPLEPAAFGLLVSAQALHWVAPDVRYSKTADALAPGGLLAIFGNVPVGLDAALYGEFQCLYKRHLGIAIGAPPEAWYLPSGPITGEISASGRFAAVVHRNYPWSRSFTASGYVEFLRTRSDHQLIPSATRDALLADIAEAIAVQGGQFDMRYETHLYLARRSI